MLDAEPERDRCAPHDVPDEVVEFVGARSEETEIPVERFIRWLGVARGWFHAWQKRYGEAHEHNALAPRDHGLIDENG